MSEKKENNIYRILIINPGSTSTKIAVFDNATELLNKTIAHNPLEIHKFKRTMDQYEMRYKLIVDTLNHSNIPAESVDCIMARGGLLKPVEGGVWKINEKMVLDLKNAERGEHASNLGAILAYNIGKKNKIPCYVADPVVVDELDNIARITGIPDLPKVSIFHALNQKFTAHKIAEQLGKKYEDLNAIVAHMGGGITIGAHKGGRVVDVNNGLYGDGPFSPERTGSIAAEQIVDLCFCSKYTKDDIKKLIHGKGGLTAYFGTSDVKEIFKDIENEKTRLVIDAMIYQIAKYISSLAVAFCGNVDVIALTGGLAHSKYIVENISKKISFLAPIFTFPGENEMDALDERAIELFHGELTIHKYK